MISKLPIIGVMGSGHREDTFPHVQPLGAKIAELGFHLLTGGGYGVMNEASLGFAKVENRKGLVIGILPSQTVMGNNPFENYPNPNVEINIQTHLVRDGGPEDPFTRNHINILTSTALVFCPGNDGTHCELDLAKAYNKPSIIYLGGDNTIDNLDKDTLKGHVFAFAQNLNDVEEFLLKFKA